MNNIKKIIFFAFLFININLYGQSVNGHSYVDLGLPSGTKWATCNVGASKPEEKGYYYAWGETDDNRSKKGFYWSTYSLCKGTETSMKKYCLEPSFGNVDNKRVLEAQDDIAFQLWGDSWRMPTKEETQELIDNCNWIYKKGNGYSGYIAESKINKKTIFFPAGGRLEYDTPFLPESGHYWTSTIRESTSKRACILLFWKEQGEEEQSIWYDNRFCGLLVRPVLNQNKSKSSIVNTQTANNYCTQCGNKVNTNDNFCGNCGKKLK